MAMPGSDTEDELTEHDREPRGVTCNTCRHPESECGARVGAGGAPAARSGSTKIKALPFRCSITRRVKFSSCFQ